MTGIANKKERSMTTREELEESIPPTMRAVRLHAPGGLEDLMIEEFETPCPLRVADEGTDD